MMAIRGSQSVAGGWASESRVGMPSRSRFGDTWGAAFLKDAPFTNAGVECDSTHPFDHDSEFDPNDPCVILAPASLPGCEFLYKNGLIVGVRLSKPLKKSVDESSCSQSAPAPNDGRARSPSTAVATVTAAGARSAREGAVDRADAGNSALFSQLGTDWNEIESAPIVGKADDKQVIVRLPTGADPDDLLLGPHKHTANRASGKKMSEARSQLTKGGFARTELTDLPRGTTVLLTIPNANNCASVIAAIRITEAGKLPEFMYFLTTVSLGERVLFRSRCDRKLIGKRYELWAVAASLVEPAETLAAAPPVLASADDITKLGEKLQALDEKFDKILDEKRATRDERLANGTTTAAAKPQQKVDGVPIYIPEFTTCQKSDILHPKVIGGDGSSVAAASEKLREMKKAKELDS
jgi:hypothetical protein